MFFDWCTTFTIVYTVVVFHLFYVVLKIILMYLGLFFFFFFLKYLSATTALIYLPVGPVHVVLQGTNTLGT